LATATEASTRPSRERIESCGSQTFTQVVAGVRTHIGELHKAKSSKFSLGNWEVAQFRNPPQSFTVPHHHHRRAALWKRGISRAS
jgi:hypothetical protein